MPGGRGRQSSGKPCVQHSIPQCRKEAGDFYLLPKVHKLLGISPWSSATGRRQSGMEAELLCISTSMVKMCPQLPLLQFCCLRGLLFLNTDITSHTHTPRELLQERLWEQGKALGRRKPKEPEELRTSDGSQHVCRLRGWSLESHSAVVHCQISGSKAAGSVAGGARLESWPGARGGCEDLVGKGRPGRILQWR